MFCLQRGIYFITFCLKQGIVTGPNGRITLDVCLGTCQKLAGGEGGWKIGEGHSFLSSSKGRVMKKMTGKEGGSQEIKPP